MQSLKTEMGAEIKGIDGSIRIIPFRECHSLLKAFIQILNALMSNTSWTVTDIGGTARTIPTTNQAIHAMAAAGQKDRGIVIGTGESNPVTMEDESLETPLTTDVDHLIQTFATENPDSDTWRMAISRGFTNNTGDAANIKEVALYVTEKYGYFYCIDHTLYAVSFNNGETLTLTYRITIKL